MATDITASTSNSESRRPSHEPPRLARDTSEPAPSVFPIKLRDHVNLRRLLKRELAYGPNGDPAHRFVAQNLIELVEICPRWRQVFDAAACEVLPGCDPATAYLDVVAVFSGLPELSDDSKAEPKPPAPPEQEPDCLPVLSLRYGTMPADEESTARFKRHRNK